MSVRRGYSLSQTSMTTWIALNSTLRLLLELCALLALMYWGIHTGDTMAEGIVIGALAPGAAIFVWWKLVAPKSASWLTDTGRLLVEMAVFGLSALALAAADQALLAISFAVVAVSTPAFSSSRPGADHIPSTGTRPPKGHRPGRCPLLLAVAVGATLRLPTTVFYDEALHAGPTEPAALTLRYPLLVRDAVDQPL